MKKDMKFEEALLLLEDITRKLEGGSLPLDESIKAYEEAVKLIALCNEKIQNAEQKVRILTENLNGEISDAPFMSEENEN
jgi:exodeoxyribonuclease VII small subunit